MLIDIDPERPSGTCATKEEKQSAITVADNILQWLNSIVPPSFPSSHSGSVGVSVCTKVNVV